TRRGGSTEFGRRPGAPRQALAQLADESHLTTADLCEPCPEPPEAREDYIAVVEDNTALVADDGEDPVAARRRAVGEIPHAVAARDLRGDRLEEVPGRDERHDRAPERVRQDSLRALDVCLLRRGRHEVVELAVVRPIPGENARAEGAAREETVRQPVIGDLDEAGVDALADRSRGLGKLPRKRRQRAVV